MGKTLEKIKYNYASWVLNIMLVFVLAVISICVYWYLEDDEVLTSLEGNYELDKDVYTQGETLNIHLRICKNKDISEQVFGSFIDGVIYAVPATASNFNVQCYDTYLTEVRIPRGLAEGTYVYEEKVVYRLNPLKTIEYTFTTPPFEVVDTRNCN